MNNTTILNKLVLPYKVFLVLIVALGLTACRKVHQPPPYPNTGRMLKVELNMPEPWKKIVIGPTHQVEYPKIPKRFSMFMTGESSGALKPYLLIEDSTGKEYAILLINVTHDNRSQKQKFRPK